MAKLGEVCKVAGSSKEISENQIWLLNLDAIEQQTGKVLTYNYVNQNALNASIIQFDADNVLYSKLRPNLNKVVLPNQQGFATSEMLPLKPDKSVLCKEYLAAYLRSDSFVAWAVSKTAGAKMPRLSTNVLLEKEIPLPPLDEQRRIAAVLDKVSGLIAKRREQLDKLDELVKARFVEMFGDPVSNPKGWNIIRLSELGDCKNGMNFHTDDSGVEIHCLGVGDFKNLSSISDTAKLPIITLNEMPTNDYLLKNGDIVFVRSNGNKALVGRSVIVYPDDTPTTFSGFCIRFRIQNPIILPQYLLSVLKTASMRKQMTGRGANIQNLNQKILSELKIPVSPLPYQEEYIDFTIKIDKSKLTIQQSLDKLEVLKKALMQQYFG